MNEEVVLPEAPLAPSPFRRTRRIAPPWPESQGKIASAALEPAVLEANAGWIGPLSGTVSAVHLVEANGVSATGLGQLYNSDAELFLDRRLAPRHLCDYLVAGRSAMRASINKLTTLEYPEPVFLVQTTKNVFGHWLLEMFPAAVVYKLLFSSTDVKFAIWDEVWRHYSEFLRDRIGIEENRLLRLPFGSHLVRFPKVYSVELFHDDYLFNGAFHQIVAYLMRDTLGLSAGQDAPRRLFVSRSRFSSKATRPPRYANVNEAEEVARRNFGFEIIHPEEMSIQSQIELFSNATHICGLGGSGLHNSIFMAPGTTTISIDFNRVQLKLAILKRQRVRFILQNAYLGTSGPADQRMDIEAFERELGACIDGMP